MKKNIYSVGQVNTYIQNMFAQDFMLHQISIKGEVSNCKYHSSGHIYFTLKDQTGTIAAVMFSRYRRGLAFQMKEGTLYPILHALEQGKYLTSYQQEAPTGRQRKYYRLTRRGRELLADKKEEWKNFRQGVSDVLSGGANALGLA